MPKVGKTHKTKSQHRKRSLQKSGQFQRVSPFRAKIEKMSGAIRNLEVRGSIPLCSTKDKPTNSNGSRVFRFLEVRRGFARLLPICCPNRFFCSLWVRFRPVCKSALIQRDAPDTVSGVLPLPSSTMCKMCIFIPKFLYHSYWDFGFILHILHMAKIELIKLVLTCPDLFQTEEKTPIRVGPVIPRDGRSDRGLFLSQYIFLYYPASVVWRRSSVCVLGDPVLCFFVH